MIFDYTPDERHQLAEIDAYYADILDRLDAAANIDAQGGYSADYIAERQEIEAERFNKMGALYDAFEQERFDALQGDPDAILANAKEQIDLIIKRDYEINCQYMQGDPRIDKNTANTIIKSGIRLHLDYLKENAPKKYDSLQRYKNRYLQNSPLVYVIEKQREQPQPPADDLLSKEFFPMLNNTATNDFAATSLKKYKVDRLTGKATYTTKNGDKYTVENVKTLFGNLATSTQKIMYTAISYLTRDNYSKGGITKATVEIPLYSYADHNGRQVTPRQMDTPEEQRAENKRADDKLKTFKKDIRNDLHDLKQVNFTWEKMRGKTKGDCAEQPIISSYRIITRDNIPMIHINFDIDTAQSLSSAGIMYFPNALLKHDNRNPNGFSIGYAIAVHNSNAQNIAAGTADTLRVKSLLADAPDIPTIDELKAKGRRDWKAQIKGKLEKALDSNIDIGYLKQWQYRDSRSGSTYTPEEASGLSWEKYYNLCIDYTILQDNPQLEDYTQRKEKEKAAAKEKKKSVQRGVS